MKIRNPREKTCKRVLDVLKRLNKPATANAIQEVTGTNYDSVVACLDKLIKQGLVKAISTTNGVFYSYSKFKNFSEESSK